MGNILISKKDIKRIIIEERCRYEFVSRKLTSSEILMCNLAADKIRSLNENIDNQIDDAVSDSSLPPGAVVGEFIRDQIASGAEMAADKIQAITNSGAVELFGDGFITTLRVDIIKLLMKMFSFPQSDILAQSLASIPFLQWPELIDDWENSGCETVTDAIVRGVSVRASRAVTDAAFDQFAKIPLIGQDLKDLRSNSDGSENRLTRVVRQMGVSASLENIEEIAGMRAVVRAQICDIDVRNLNLGNLDQLKGSLLGILALVPGGGSDTVQNLADSAEEISQLSPSEAADILGRGGESIESIDDSFDSLTSEEGLPASPDGYDEDYFDKLQDIVDDTIPEVNTDTLQDLRGWIDSRF